MPHCKSGHKNGCQVSGGVCGLVTRWEWALGFPDLRPGPYMSQCSDGVLITIASHDTLSYVTFIGGSTVCPRTINIYRVRRRVETLFRRDRQPGYRITGMV